MGQDGRMLTCRMATRATMRGSTLCHCGAGGSVVGVLGVAGTDEIRSLIQPAPEPDQARLPTGLGARDGAGHEEQLTLFAAFCDQIALALDRSALQQQAIHAEALRESDQLKDVLLGSVTHDLRTPLASIKAAVSSLLQPDMTWSDEERRDFLTSIDASADRLNRLVGNLLDLSRLEAGSAPPEKDWYPIGEVVATVLDRLDLTGQTRQHQIVVDIPRGHAARADGLRADRTGADESASRMRSNIRRQAARSVLRRARGRPRSWRCASRIRASASRRTS